MRGQHQKSALKKCHVLAQGVILLFYYSWLIHASFNDYFGKKNDIGQQLCRIPRLTLLLQKYAPGRIIGQENQKYVPGGVFFLGGGAYFRKIPVLLFLSFVV